MDPEKIQNDIDALLTYINDDMERIGGTIKDTYWGFAQGEEDRNAIENYMVGQMSIYLEL